MAAKKKSVSKKTEAMKKQAAVRQMARQAASRRTPSYKRAEQPHYSFEDAPTAGLGVIVLLLNAVVLPGLGSLIGRRINAGLIQLILAILGQLFLGSLVHSQLAAGIAGLHILQWIGLVLVIVSWIWGIVTGILVIRDGVRAHHH